MAKSIEEVKRAVDEYFADTSRSQAQTAADLRDLTEHIDLQLESLDVDDE